MSRSNTASKWILGYALAAGVAFAACSQDAPPPPPKPVSAPKADTAKLPPPKPEAANLAAAKPAANSGAPAPEIDPNAKRALTAFADGDETVGEPPHTIKLDVEVLEGTGTPPFTYVWDFGDATPTTTEKAPSHTYTIPGSFRASVIIRDSAGDVDQDWVDVTVMEKMTEEQMVRMQELIRKTQAEMSKTNPGLAKAQEQLLEAAKKAQARQQKPAAPAQ